MLVNNHWLLDKWGTSLENEELPSRKFVPIVVVVFNC